jgi:hypothetical protein
MSDFDPLFDDDDSDLSLALGLALPPVVPPVVPHAHGGAHFLFENVGTIALPGLHDRIEQLPITSSTSTSSSPTTSQSSPRRLSQHKPSSRVGKGNAAQGKRVRKPKKPALRKPPGPYKPETPTEQILANLASDPNVLPLLQHIVEHIFRTQLSSDPPPPPPVVSSDISDERPTKRRRLYRVPAGAEYWPQPFPFREGEGPVHYRETWHMRHMIVLLKALVKGLRNQKRNNSQTILERKAFTPPAIKPVRRRRPALPCVMPTSTSSPIVQPQTPHIYDPAPHTQMNTTSQAPDDALVSPIPDLAIPPLPMPGDLDATLDRLLALFAMSDAVNAQGTPSDQQLNLNLDVDALTGTNDISQLFYTTEASAAPQLFEWDRWIDSSNILLPQLSENTCASNSGTVSLATPELSWSGLNTELPMVMDIDGTVSANVGCDKQATVGFIGEPDQQLYGELTYFNSEIFDMMFIDSNIAETVRPEALAFSSSLVVPPLLDPGPLNQPLDSLAEPIYPMPTASHTQLPLSPARTTITMAMEVDHPISSLPFPSTLEIVPAPPFIATQPQPQRKPIPSPWSSIPGAIPISDFTLAHRAQILQRAKGLRSQLEKELEDTKLHRWQTLMEHSVLSAVLVRGGKALAARENDARTTTAKGSKRK